MALGVSVADKRLNLPEAGDQRMGNIPPCCKPTTCLPAQCGNQALAPLSKASATLMSLSLLPNPYYTHPCPHIDDAP